MNKTATESRYKHSRRYAIPREGHFHSPRPPRSHQMDLRCPNCHTSDLKRVSLAYQEGLSRVKSKSRLRAFLFGEDGPNVIVGSAVTRGTHQTELSRNLRPPKKWSYRKVLLWAGIVSVISLIFYTHTVMASSSVVSALPVVVFGAIGLSAFLVLLLLVARHNLLVYPRQYAEWDRSYVCQRCGAVNVQRVSDGAP